MQLVDSAQLPLSAIAYANDIQTGIQAFLKQYADTLARNIGKSQPVKDLQVTLDELTSQEWVKICVVV